MHSNKLPVIIDAKGLYLCKNGQIVDIHEVDQETTPETTSMAFKCKGYLFKVTKTGRVKKEWNIWHLSGRFTAFPGNPLDITRKVTEDEFMDAVNQCRAKSDGFN